MTSWDPLKIDPQKLPRIVAVDAGVLIRALEPRHVDKFAQACRDFWNAMLADKTREIIIPAPSLAEHLRKGTTRPPNTEQVYVVPFGVGATELLAQRLGHAVLDVEIEEFKAEYGEDAPGGYIKYDAMIVACAKFYGAQRIVSIDRGVAKLASKMPIDCCVPSYFYGDPPRQPSLFPPGLTVLPKEDDSEAGER